MAYDEGELGTGWSFPPQFDKRYTKVDMVSDRIDIRQSLFILFSTMPGEHIIAPEYGCNLRQYAFEIFDEELISQIKQTVQDAVIAFEHRIKIENIDVTHTHDHLGQRIDILLEYTIVKTDEEDKITVPVRMG